MKTLAETIQMLGGVFLYLQILILLLLVILAIQKFIRFFTKQDLARVPFHRSHHAILFLGIFSFVWGMFTQLVGLVMALNAIIEAADVSPQLIIMGLKNSFISPLFGLGTMLFSAVLWAILHAKYSSSLKE